MTKNPALNKWNLVFLTWLHGAACIGALAINAVTYDWPTSFYAALLFIPIIALVIHAMMTGLVLAWDWLKGRRVVA